MILFKPSKGVKLIYTLSFIIILAFFSCDLLASSGGGGVHFNPEFKLKSYSGKVTVYTVTEQGKKVEYTFNEFHADVLLLVYRRLDLNQIIERMAEKYSLTKKVSRRCVKMTINTLELWDIVIRS